MKAGAQCDQPLVVIAKELLIYAGFIVKSFEMSDRQELAQVSIAFNILDQQHQVKISAFAFFRVLVQMTAGGHINLASNDGFEVFGFRFLVEVDGPEHVAVIGDGYRRHTELGGALEQVIQANGAVEEAVLGVNVQMHERIGTHVTPIRWCWGVSRKCRRQRG
jgi:hypothetical protein